MRLGYRPELDGLRGIAIALVVAFHAFGWPPGGTVGVDLFFVLSGFLISTLLLEEHHATRTISIRNFYARRARRLFPALAALLAPFVFLVIVGAAVGSFQTRTAVGVGAALTYTSNIVVAVDPSAVPAAMIHLWSLAAEEQFYVLWPLALVVLLRLGGLRFVVSGLGVLLAVAIFYRLELVAGGASIERLYYGPDTHADALLIGCAFGCLFVGRRLPRSLTSSARVRLAVGGGALVLVAATAMFLDRVPERLAYQAQLLPTLFALAAGTLIVSAVAGPSALTVALCTRPLAFLGRISYSLYLWHLPLLVALAGVHRHAGVATLAAVSIALVFATASRRFVELPFLARGGERKRRDASASPAVAPA